MGYREGKAEVHTTGKISGDVLDVGCGTGENTPFLESRGHQIWGVDSAAAAIKTARGKAEERGLAATFQVKDALRLHDPHAGFARF